MMNDPRTYKNPEVFNPLRYIGKKPESDPRAWAFGFGRRVCPGETARSLFIMIA